MKVPFYYIGTMNCCGIRPDIELFNLTAPVGPHQAGATLTRESLAKLGFVVPLHPTTDTAEYRQWDAGRKEIEAFLNARTQKSA
jgi:hypothetical protein